MAAARLHQRLGLRHHIEARGGNVDIFGAIQMLDLPLLLRPLQGLLGAYLNEPSPGILVTTQRPMSIQRFTAAHELGHFSLHHRPSLDDETILRRMPMPEPPTGDFQEVEADAFAVMFMMPRWLIAWHAERQRWKTENFRRPNVVYQLSLGYLHPLHQRPGTLSIALIATRLNPRCYSCSSSYIFNSHTSPCE